MTEGSTHPADRKAIERQRAREARRSLSGAVRRMAEDAVVASALALPELASARAVLAYHALADELDPGPIVEVLRARGLRIAYPRVVPGACALTFHWVGGDHELGPGSFGILEPAENAPSARPDEIDVVLVPGVAFDAACVRIGHGVGYYDAMLPDFPTTTALVGLAFDEQIAEGIDAEPHDHRMHVVVTPTRVIRRGDAG